MAGIVVDHKETGVRYAVSEHNFNQDIHTKVRDLGYYESVLNYKPKATPKGGTATEGDQPEDTEPEGVEPDTDQDDSPESAGQL